MKFRVICLIVFFKILIQQTLVCFRFSYKEKSEKLERGN